MSKLLRSRKRRSKWSGRKVVSRSLCLEYLEHRELLTTVVWSAGPELPAPRTDAVAVVAPDNSVYLLGGDAASPTAAPQLQAGGTAWISGQDIDTQRNDLGAARAGNEIYLFGGTGNDEGNDEVLSYDYRFGNSQDVAKMDTVRYDLGYAADAAGRAYAIGGIGVFEDGEIWSQAERYDRASDTWTAIAPLPVALHGLSAIGDGDGHVFVFGGSTTLDDSGIQSTSFSYDIASDAWTTIAPMPTATRDSAVVMDHQGAIYVLGGMASAGATDDVQVYDPETNSWTAQTDLPQPIYSHAAAFDSLGRIVVAGGFDASGAATAAVSQTQRLTVAETAPVITTSPVVDASLDRFYNYDVDATGNPTPAYSLVASPSGMTIDSVSGLISWQPVAGQLGSHSVTVRASNVVGDVDQSFDISVVADTIAPTTPGNFLVDSTTETSVTLNWDASTDATGVDRYELSTAVYTGPRFGKHWVYTVVDTVTTTTSTRTGLTPLSSATYSVQAFDAAGNASARSPRISATTLAAPTLTFSAGGQTTGTVESPAKHPLEIQLRSTANPTATFSLVSGPASMTVDSTTGLVQWTPTVAEIGLHTVTFRATNSVGSTNLDVTIDVMSDAPQLSVEYNPTTGGERFALAGTLFTAQINDSSQSASTYELITAPTGMTIESATGLVSWTPAGTQGGTQAVTVRGTNAGGAADLAFNVDTLFTGAATGFSVTGTTLLEPTASWVAPTGEGADLVDSYLINGSATWGVGRTEQTHRVSYTVPASETSVLMTEMVTGKAYTIYVTPIDAAGNLGLRDAGTVVVSTPALPIVRWAVNGFVGGLSVPGPVIAEQPVEIVLTDERVDPSTMTLVSGPAGLTFDPVTNTGNWTPTAADVTTGYDTTSATFQATNSVGSVDVTVPMRVFFSGTVRNAVTTRFDDDATASWDPPTDNVTPIAAYSITRSWTWSGRPRSITWTVGGDVTSISFGLIPTGAVSHKGITITPVDENGNFGVSTERILYGQRQNDSPPIAVDDAYSTSEDTTLAVDFTSGVRANDIDTDNTPFFNPLTSQLVTGPANGTLTLDSTGSFTYSPNADFNGVDTFIYRAYDGNFYSDNATATITVDAVNDGPLALDDYYTVDQDQILTIIDAAAGVLANDSDVDGDVLTVVVVDNPASGSVSLSATGVFSYTPNPGFSGNDSFTYVASDSSLDSRTATVSIEVNAPTTKFFVVDFNEDGNVDASTDGNQILVVLFGLPDANLTPFRGATPLTNVEIAANVQELRDNLVLDVNADGAVDASTDGNLILVVLFGLPDSNLTPFRGSTALSNAQIKQNILDLTAVSAPLVAASVAVAEPEVTVVSEMPMELIIGQQTPPQKPTPVSEDDEDEVSMFGLFEHVMSTENPVLPPDTGSENYTLIDEIAVDVANEWQDDLDELWWEQESDPFF